MTDERSSSVRAGVRAARAQDVLRLEGDVSPVHDPAIIRADGTYSRVRDPGAAGARGDADPHGGGTPVIGATTPAWRGPGHQAVPRDGAQHDPVFHA